MLSNNTLVGLVSKYFYELSGKSEIKDTDILNEVEWIVKSIIKNLIVMNIILSKHKTPDFSLG
jgi:hypothetical protein